MSKGIYKRTEEHKQRMSEARRGIKLSEKTKRKISLSSIGKPPTSGSFKKGHFVSEETKKKIIISNTGRISWNKGKHLSKKTKKKISNSILKGFKNGRTNWLKGTRGLITQPKGEKNSLWKGNRTKNKIIRQSIEFKLWREAIFVRDNWICQKYGIKGGKLHPHHIKNFAQYPELRFAIDNGITLSEKAHKEFHKKYGIKNNTRKQLKEFLNKKICPLKNFYLKNLKKDRCPEMNYEITAEV